MSVMVQADGIQLSGRCSAEDAESLLVALQDQPDGPVDLAQVQRMHTAVLQLLLALRPTISQPPPDPLLREMILSARDLE